jgi:hypothetical protein
MFIYNFQNQTSIIGNKSGEIMSEKQKVVLSALIAAIIAGGGAFLGVASELGDNENLNDIRLVTWLVIIVIALVAAAKDLKTYLAKPPKV